MVKVSEIVITPAFVGYSFHSKFFIYFIESVVYIVFEGFLHNVFKPKGFLALIRK